MGFKITRAQVDKYRESLKNAEPYTDEELFDGSEVDDPKRAKATFAKNILTHFGLSLTDENDYGDIEE